MACTAQETILYSSQVFTVASARSAEPRPEFCYTTNISRLSRTQETSESCCLLDKNQKMYHNWCHIWVFVKRYFTEIWPLMYAITTACLAPDLKMCKTCRILVAPQTRCKTQTKLAILFRWMGGWDSLPPNCECEKKRGDEEVKAQPSTKSPAVPGCWPA